MATFMQPMTPRLREVGHHEVDTGEQLARHSILATILRAQSHDFARSPGISLPMIVGHRSWMKVAIEEPGRPIILRWRSDCF